ncbi:hypothetical protein NIASO_13720 [Niabella soli DSM 19437]|uniref:Uncharacterized protein n=1 Tax=Niabella soli DSM 19437 TaxID=929713 RepID=W0F8H6_9BACT|nr:hypothetical protein NIASO_13720 [Niabella soli DSM 19437]
MLKEFKRTLNCIFLYKELRVIKCRNYAKIYFRKIVFANQVLLPESETSKRANMGA